MKNEHLLLLGIIFVALLVYAGYIPIHPVGQQQVVTVTTGGGTMAVVPASGFSPGDFSMIATAYDDFVPGTSIAIATTAWAATYYIQTGGNYQSIGAASTAATGATIVVPAESGGIVYVAVTGGSSYYIDAPKTKANDAKIQSYSYMDIGNTGTKNFVFAMSLATVARLSGYPPQVAFNLWLLKYVGPTVSTVSDTVTTSTVTTDIFSEFYTTAGTVNSGYIITKVDVYIMQCSGSYTPQAYTGDYQYVKINIPGKGYVDITGSMQIRTNDLYYSYVLGSDLGDGYYIKTGQNDLNKQYYTLDRKVSFGASDPEFRVCWTLYYIVPGASGTWSIATVTDSVYDMY